MSLKAMAIVRASDLSGNTWSVQCEVKPFGNNHTVELSSVAAAADTWEGLLQTALSTWILDTYSQTILPAEIGVVGGIPS